MLTFYNLVQVLNILVALAEIGLFVYIVSMPPDVEK